MIDVLAFVYQHYWRADAYPEPLLLGRKLSAHGFDDEEIGEALHWLDALSLATQGIDIVRPEGEAGTARIATRPVEAGTAWTQSPGALRVYAVAEQSHLGAECLAFIRFLEAADALPGHIREIVIDRAMAAPGAPVELGTLKIILLLVYRSSGIEPAVLVQAELCENAEKRVGH